MEILPVNELEPQKDNPSCQLHQRYYRTQYSLEVHFRVETSQNQPQKNDPNSCDSEGEVQYLGIRYKLSKKYVLSDTSKEIVTGDKRSRTRAEAKIVVKVYSCIADSAQRSCLVTDTAQSQAR